jgi:ankyrin repeat protein
MEKDKDLHQAIRIGDIETLWELISDPNIDLECQNENKQTPLSNALQNRIGVIVKLLVEARVDIEAETDRIPLLIWAARNGDENVVGMLLKKGANANPKDQPAKCHYSSLQSMDIQMLQVCC